MKNEFENIVPICPKLIGQQIQWIIIPPHEYDIGNNTFWLEEAQGSREENKTYKSELLIQLKDSNKKFLISMTFNWHNDKEVWFPLCSLIIQEEGELAIMKLEREKGQENVIGEIDFYIANIELWNRKDNYNNVYIKDNIIRADTMILYSNDNRQLVIQAIESSSQENAISLRLRSTSDKMIELEKKYEMEIINKV